MEVHRQSTADRRHRRMRKPTVVAVILLTGSFLFITASYNRRLTSSLSSSLCSSGSSSLNLSTQKPQYKGGCVLSYKESCIIPKVVLLMSFPNSGTSYTLRMAQGISNHSIGTNYQKELKNQTVEFVITGTFSPFKKNVSLPLPQLVLTKTHCMGFLQADGFHFTADDFDVACRSIDMHSNGTVRKTAYSPNIIAAAVHLVRHPLNNLVARMHLWIQRRRGTPAWRDDFDEKLTESPQGLLAWCAESDMAERSDVEQVLFMKGVDEDLYLGLPCLVELNRYIQWHTHAIHFLQRYQLPTLTLYYESYSTNYFKTVTTLLKFLRLDVVNEPHEFVEGKSYLNLYSPMTVQRIEKFMRAAAPPECWELIRHYFESDTLTVAALE